MALRNHWSRHDRCCWGRTGFQQLGGGAGRAGTCAVYRPLLARPSFQRLSLLAWERFDRRRVRRISA
ncbi:hypothetical protein MPL1032_20803 [Mesorhizobium plurifarium]|uniref:Uncharacterized protein n=1 Tax=Mesorhizobium plurifarium TaxID=69974 RepID=A0A0K2VYK0_MESPL|nr:hypothetical protein MPL1032_20803 [Mesorhizobium plurifarium]